MNEMKICVRGSFYIEFPKKCNSISGKIKKNTHTFSAFLSTNTKLIDEKKRLLF